MMDVIRLFLLVLSALHSIGIIESAPVTVIDFNDDWEFTRIKRHIMPLLNGTTKNHILPPASKAPGQFTVLFEKSDNRTPKKLGNAVRSSVSCGACKLGVGLLSKEIMRGTNFEDIKQKFVQLCVSFKIQTEPICVGVFNVYGPEVVPALNASIIGPEKICSLVLGEVCGDIENPIHEWEIKFPDVPKPAAVEQELSKPGLPTFKIIQISDTHFDPDYVEGSPVNCQEPLCCRHYCTWADNETQVHAGKWGSYRCDAPKHLINNMLQNIAEEHPDVDYIIWTGDLPPHDIWNQTKKSNSDIIHETVKQMFEYFPNTPIFPAIGNHESAPAGSFAPPWVKDSEHSINWLYREMADHWRRWLPASSGNTVLHGGFYSILLRPNFRLISLNTNYCHTLSWWLVVNSTDPAKELQWLVNELQEAENNNEKVHLIGHIPPGSPDCMKVWSRNFYAIVDRYQNTIVAQFYGHTHADEFEVFYETKEHSRPTNVAYLGPSVTTYEYNNPAYRIYYIDGDHNKTTREVLDHETWTTNLEDANQSKDDPKWYRLYSARDAYDMKSLRPHEWGRLIERMVNDPGLFDLFYKHYYRDSPTRPSCSEPSCKLQILCDLKSGKSHDKHHLCHELELNFGA